MGKAKRIREERKETQGMVQAFLAKYSKEVNREIGKQLAAENDRFYASEMACVLWVLHRVFGFGRKRLLTFVWNYQKEIRKLSNFYLEEYEGPGTQALCAEALRRETGIDTVKMTMQEIEKELGL